MDLSELVENSKSINISIYSLIIISVVILGLIVFLIGVILYLIKRIRALTKIRYGFGGKPLFSILVVVSLTLAIPLTMYASLRTVNYINLARAERDVTLEIYPTLKEKDLYNVSFLAIPTINEEPWLDKEYTITWSIEGKKSLEKVEKDRSKDKPSYFKVELPSGSYQVKVLVESKDFDVVKTEEFTLE